MKPQTQAPVVAHTPTPWESAGCGIYQPDLWRDGINHGGRFVASTFDSELHPDCPSDTDLANADFICLAVNSHAALVDALQRIMEMSEAARLSVNDLEWWSKPGTDGQFKPRAVRQVDYEAAASNPRGICLSIAAVAKAALAHGTKEVQS